MGLRAQPHQVLTRSLAVVSNKLSNYSELGFATGSLGTIVGILEVVGIDMVINLIVNLDKGLPACTVLGEVDLWALLLDVIDLLLGLIPLVVLVSDLLLDSVDGDLQVLPGNFGDLTAWVVTFALLESFPALLDELGGSLDGGLNIKLEGVQHLVPLLVDLLGVGLLDLLTAGGTFSAGIKKLTGSVLLIVPGGDLDEIGKSVHGWAGGVDEPVSDLAVNIIDVLVSEGLGVLLHVVVKVLGGHVTGDNWDWLSHDNNGLLNDDLWLLHDENLSDWLLHDENLRLWLSEWVDHVEDDLLWGNNLFSNDDWLWGSHVKDDFSWLLVDLLADGEGGTYDSGEDEGSHSNFL